MNLFPCGKKPPGFALVVTLSLMVLLAILALGMLSLSSISLRSSSHSTAISEARANARMALMLAIGELQRQAGSDMRITAPADILDSGNPPLTGVWKSWEGTNQEQSGTLRGRPRLPDYLSKTIPASTSGGRFVSWLVSGPISTGPIKDQPKSLVQKTASAGTVPIVSTGSLADTDLRQVHLVPQKTVDNGAIAWWISGENQKALSPKPYDKPNPSIAGWADRNRSHAVADPEPFGMNRILADPKLANKAVTRGSADFIADGAGAATPTESFHDLSANSMGLLTNVATGGWRKDLSLLTEKWDEQPFTGLEFFKISPTESLEYTRPRNAADYQPANSMLYHWADHRVQTPGVREYWTRRGPISSWARVKSHATLYKKMSATSSRMPNINHQSWQDDGTDITAALAFHEIRILPQMARIQMIVSHYAKPEPSIPGNFRPAVLYTPVLTMWNPYNTRLTLNSALIVNPAQGYPLALNHKFSGAGAPSLPDEFWAVQRTVGPEKSFSPMNWRFIFNLPNPLILEPGETRIFSPPATLTSSSTLPYLIDATNTAAPTISLTPGVRTGVGIYFTLDRRLDPSGAANPALVSLPGGTTMDVDAKFNISDKISRTSGLPICGSDYQWFIGSFGSGRSHSWFQLFYDKKDADKLYPPMTGLASDQLLKFSTKPMAFLSMSMGSRIANFRATATKGMVQANPIVETFSSGADGRWSDPYPGSNTLLNYPWDFSVVAHPSGGGDMLPNVDNTTSSSYIVTGVTKGTGVSRMVVAELPTRPLASLAELSHMQIRSSNPTPPYAADIVANSDATPLIPANGIVNPANVRANARNNEQQDDSYCLNQVFFDDWFFSSIAPEPDGFGSSSGSTLAGNFTEFLTGADPLTNRAYHPIPEDQVTDPAKASAIFTARVQPADSWKTIASRLEVEGMFNVNSTSVKAWRALLGHARNQKIPYTRADGSIPLSGNTDYAVSRTSVAGDLAAGEPPQVVGDYADTTEFTGHRLYTDEMLDFLAEEIVEQVRLRGPFLSLSEFVNRKLTNASAELDLALAGAIQTALNKLTANASLNPFEAMQNESVASVGKPFADDPTNALTAYVFPEAAAGHNTYGLPSWTRQADILRPLAPILSARDDTFTIRAYGEARAPDGTVQARAWCEATVSREREFVDPADAADLTTPPTQAVNVTYGRRFKVLTFRWLNRDEV